MKAADVITALRTQHPELSGEWVCYRECWRIDLFAMRCWTGSPGRRRIAYEVKVSRGDFLNELRHPEKRQNALDLSHQFYFACPIQMIAPTEVPEETGLVWVDGKRVTIAKRAPIRKKPRAFTEDEIIYLARWGLYKEGIQDLHQKNVRLKGELAVRKQQVDALSYDIERLEAALLEAAKPLLAKGSIWVEQELAHSVATITSVEEDENGELWVAFDNQIGERLQHRRTSALYFLRTRRVSSGLQLPD